MRSLLPTIGIATLLALGACAPMPRASTMMTPASAGGSSAMPQSPNSLPPGDVVNAPRTSPVGAVTNTTVR